MRTPTTTRGAPILDVNQTAEQVALHILNGDHAEAARVTLHRNRTRPDRAAAVAVTAALIADADSADTHLLNQYIVALCANDQTREAIRQGTPAATPVDPDEFSF